MGELYQVDSKFLDEIVDLASRTTVGKCLKRYEIINDKEVLKANLREVIYEEFRNLKSLIEIHAKSLAFTLITFKNDKNKTTTN